VELVEPRKEEQLLGNKARDLKVWFVVRPENTTDQIRVCGHLKLFDRYLTFSMLIGQEPDDRGYHPLLGMWARPRRAPFTVSLFAAMLEQYSGERYSSPALLLCQAADMLTSCRVDLSEISAPHDDATANNAAYVRDGETVYDLTRIEQLDVVRRSIRRYTVYFYLDAFLDLSLSYPSQKPQIRELGPQIRERLHQALRNDPETLCFQSCAQLPYNPLGMLEPIRYYELQRMSGRTHQIAKRSLKPVIFYRHSLLGSLQECERFSSGSTRRVCPLSSWIQVRNSPYYAHLFEYRRVFYAIWMQYTAVIPTLLQGIVDPDLTESLLLAQDTRHPQYGILGLPVHPSSRAQRRTTTETETPDPLIDAHLYGEGFTHDCFLVNGYSRYSARTLTKSLRALLDGSNPMPPPAIRRQQLGLGEEEKPIQEQTQVRQPETLCKEAPLPTAPVVLGDGDSGSTREPINQVEDYPNILGFDADDDDSWLLDGLLSRYGDVKGADSPQTDEMRPETTNNSSGTTVASTTTTSTPVFSALHGGPTATLEHSVDMDINSDEHDDHELLHRISDADMSHVYADPQLSALQREALERCGTSFQPLVLVTGGPGTGKTSKVLANVWRMRPLEYLILANAGMAVDRIVEVITAQVPGATPRVEVVAYVDELLKHDPTARLAYTTALIIDEASTVNLHDLARLISRMPHLQQLIMIGDVDQTAPIGAGYPFRDLLDTMLHNCIRLDCNYRVGAAAVHAANAACILNATERINSMKFLRTLPVDTRRLDCVMIEQKLSVRENVEQVLGYVRQCFGEDHMRLHTQFITPYRKVCAEYRKHAKAYIYGEHLGTLPETCLHRGQRIVFRANVKECFHDGLLSQRVRNGETAVIIELFARRRNSLETALTNVYLPVSGSDKVKVPTMRTASKKKQPSAIRDSISIAHSMAASPFPDVDDVAIWALIRTPNGSRKQVCLDLLNEQVFDASCITGHSSQGSEYTTVVLVIPYFSAGSKHILNSSLLYTMYTRAKSHVIVLYQKQPVPFPYCDQQLRTLGSFTNMACTPRPTIDTYLWHELYMELV